jgi:hypothetical protein
MPILDPVIVNLAVALGIGLLIEPSGNVEKVEGLRDHLQEYAPSLRRRWPAL